MEILDQSKTKAHQGKGQTQVQCLGTMTSSMLLSGPTLPALLFAVYVIFLRSNLLHDHSFPSKRYLMCLASPAPWSLYYNVASLPQPHTQTSQEICVENLTVLHVVWPQQLSRAWLKPLMSPFVFVSCLLSTAVPYEDCCQLLLPAKHVI